MMTLYGIPFLEKRNTLGKFLATYGNINFRGNPHVIEAVCYAHILVGDYTKARFILWPFRRVLLTEIDKSPGVAWIVNMGTRVQTILDLLENKSLIAAKEQLDQWRNYTLENLRTSDL